MFFTSCQDEDVASLELSLPESTSSAWFYSIYTYNDSDTTKIGNADSRIAGKSRYQGKENVIELVRRVRLDSLANSPTPETRTSSFLQFSEGYVHLFGDTYFDLYDQLLHPSIIDTIAANGTGEDFQSFQFFQPNWVKWLNIEWNPDYNLTVLEENPKVYIDFLYRSERINGFVTLSMETKFDAYDRVLIKDTTSVVAYRYLNKGFLDFNLKRDTVQLPGFRTTISLYIWLHQNGGLLKRERKPVEIYIPQIPSRYPIVYVPGEYWQVDSTISVTF
ncbi:MAG: hypothetical protein GW809_08300 [Bacteroidetes bacterium]|nr:hypothetical protein [Bacteroidota bacterium]